jgi:metal-dependent amidase/aminoacylase/carboxypeptidase family protein
MSRPLTLSCRLFGPDNVKTIDPIMPAEDFAFFLQKVPGAMIFLGHFDEKTGNDASLHNPRYHLHEGILPRGAAYFAALATQFLQEGGFPANECPASKKA